jgi:hypothetical protein
MIRAAMIQATPAMLEAKKMINPTQTSLLKMRKALTPHEKVIRLLENMDKTKEQPRDQDGSPKQFPEWEELSQFFPRWKLIRGPILIPRLFLRLAHVLENPDNLLVRRKRIPHLEK